MTMFTKHVWYPYTQMKTAPEPTLIKRAERIFLYDENENKIIDAISSWWVNIHGHANPKIAEAIFQQAIRCEQIIFAGLTHQPALELASKLSEMVKMPDAKVFFSDNGSTAVEVAIKMAIQYHANNGHKKNLIVSWENDFHGETFGAMSVSDQDGFNKSFKDHLFQTIKIRIPKNLEDIEAFEYIDRVFKMPEIAAFLFEPLIQGAGGMEIYDVHIFDSVLKKAKENKIICIADEVMTGCYRTGKFIATLHTSIKPDIICMAKGLTGGFLPLAVTIANKFIFDAFYSNDKSKALFHGHSYTANPLGCAAANVSLKLMCKSEFLEHQNNLQIYVKSKVAQYQMSHPEICARSIGSIFAVNIPTTSKGYFSAIKEQIESFFLERNVFVRPLGNVLYFMPPLIITLDEYEEIFSILDLFLKKSLFLK